ncbi:MAG: hypothetical protein J5I59_07395 [Saprospiraceae bacterium]|nr:hypothetical protein [Saprospiraceae bacterium]
MKAQHLIPLLFLVMTVSCEKEDIPKNCCSCTTPTTTSGANTLSFDLDGVTWSPCDAVKAEGKTPEITAERYRLFGYDRITIRATQQHEIASKNDNLFIIINHPSKGKINHSGEFPIGSIYLSVLSETNPRYSGQYNTINSGLPFNLEVTRFDTINKIISGVFDCTLIEDNGGIDTSKIQITNGRFDVRYN